MSECFTSVRLSGWSKVEVSTPCTTPTSRSRRVGPEHSVSLGMVRLPDLLSVWPSFVSHGPFKSRPLTPTSTSIRGGTSRSYPRFLTPRRDSRLRSEPQNPTRERTKKKKKNRTNDRMVFSSVTLPRDSDPRDNPRVSVTSYRKSVLPPRYPTVTGG